MGFLNRDNPAIEPTRRWRIDLGESRATIIDAPQSWEMSWYNGSSYSKKLHNALQLLDDKGKLRATWVEVESFRDMSIPVRYEESRAREHA